MRNPKQLTPAQALAKAQREALHGHWELLLLQQMRAERLPVPERQLKFAAHLGREWAFDFAWRLGEMGDREFPMIAVEVEGGTGKRGVGCGRCRGQGNVYAHGFLTACTACRGRGRLAGRHNSSEGYERDLEKYNFASALGWRVYRFSSEMIKDGRAIQFLLQHVDGLRRTP